MRRCCKKNGEVWVYCSLSPPIMGQHGGAPLGNICGKKVRKLTHFAGLMTAKSTLHNDRKSLDGDRFERGSRAWQQTNGARQQSRGDAMIYFYYYYFCNFNLYLNVFILFYYYYYICNIFIYNVIFIIINIIFCKVNLYLNVFIFILVPFYSGASKQITWQTNRLEAENQISNSCTSRHQIKDITYINVHGMENFVNSISGDSREGGRVSVREDIWCGPQYCCVLGSTVINLFWIHFDQMGYHHTTQRGTSNLSQVSESAHRRFSK